MADVAAALADWSTTASSNLPADATTIGAGLADNFQQIQATLRGALAYKGADIASATTTDLGAVTGHQHDITGTTTITGFGTVSAGIWKIIKFEGALTLTHNATSLILPGGANITTANGDVAIMVSEGSGNWRCASYMVAATVPISYTIGTFTPSDGSGAGLSFTSVTGSYTKIGNKVHVQLGLTYPTTADGSGASIAGLPFESRAGITSILSCLTDQGTAMVGKIAASATSVQPKNMAMDTSFTNANLSGKTLTFTGSYLV